MKAILYLSFLLFAGSSFKSYGQQAAIQKQAVSPELQRQKQESNHYRKTLQLDSAQAKEVAKIQASYKSALKMVIADTSLNDAAKRARIMTLMEAKNQQLRTMLSPAQQEKIIPSTERTVTPEGAVNKP